MVMRSKLDRPVVVVVGMMLIVGLILTAVPGGIASTAVAQESDRESSASSGQLAEEIVSSASDQATREWTPERMRNAKPYPLGRVSPWQTF